MPEVRRLFPFIFSLFTSTSHILPSSTPRPFSSAPAASACDGRARRAFQSCVQHVYGIWRTCLRQLAYVAPPYGGDVYANWCNIRHPWRTALRHCRFSQMRPSLRAALHAALLAACRTRGDGRVQLHADACRNKCGTVGEPGSWRANLARKISCVPCFGAQDIFRGLVNHNSRIVYTRNMMQVRQGCAFCSEKSRKSLL